MARKSKDTLLKERLISISKCPADIFDRIADSDEFFTLLEKSESGDLNATKELIAQIRSSNIGTKKESDALLYLLKKGMTLSDVESAKTFISYFLAYKHGYELIPMAIDILEKSDVAPSTLNSLKCYYAISLPTDKDGLNYSYNTLAEIGYEGFMEEWIYLTALSKKEKSELPADIIRMARDVGLSALLSLLSFDDADREIKKEDALSAIAYVRPILDKHTLFRWRDFWVRRMYELCEKHLDGDFTSIAEDVIATSERRPFYKYHSLHTYAWAKYLADKIPEDNVKHLKASALSNEFYDKCRFERISPVFKNEQEQYEVMRSCVYLSSQEELTQAISDSEFGLKIEYYKNRYTLCATLKSHGKRGKIHFWNVTLSLPESNAPKMTLPDFSQFYVTETRKVISRGGATLDYDKSSSQVLLRGEILLNNIPHPFELDLILDISFISAVKCGEGAIQIKSSKQKDGFIIMSCQLMLY